MFLFLFPLLPIFFVLGPLALMVVPFTFNCRIDSSRFPQYDI